MLLTYTLANAIVMAMKLNEYLIWHENAASLARKLNINPALISQYRHDIRSVPVERCFVIEQATNGQVTRKDLRPDDWYLIWPELAQQENKSEEAA